MLPISNRKINKVDFEKRLLIPKIDDDLNRYSKEYNKMLLDKATSSNGIIQEKCTKN